MGRRIRAWRLAKGWTQEQLAVRVGVSFETISRYEAGKRRLLLDSIERLAEAFGVAPAELLLAGTDLPADEALLLGQWRRLGEAERQVLLQLLGLLAGQQDRGRVDQPPIT